MPKWGLSMESGKVTDWLVAVGDELTEGSLAAPQLGGNGFGRRDEIGDFAVQLIVGEQLADRPAAGAEGSPACAPVGRPPAAARTSDGATA